MARLVNIIHLYLKIVNKPGEHWKVHLNDRSPHDPYRRWMYDWRGFRKDDWHRAPNECLEKVEKVFFLCYHCKCYYLYDYYRYQIYSIVKYTF